MSALLFSGCVWIDDALHEPARLQVGARAPNLEFPLLDGGQLPLDALRGREVLIKFWASYCGACGRSASEFAETRSAFDHDNVVVLSVSLDEDRGDAEEAAKSWGLDAHPIVFYGAGYDDDPAKAAFGVASIPETFWIAPDGRVRARGRNLDPAQIRQTLARRPSS
ncbi:MAG: TlpA disulfide reductase family protein [Deltaproteobacteria bacterium]